MGIMCIASYVLVIYGAIELNKGGISNGRANKQL